MGSSGEDRTRKLTMAEPPSSKKSREDSSQADLTGGATRKAPNTGAPTLSTRLEGFRESPEKSVRNNYLNTVTVPWTVGMLLMLVVFLWVMRTDGPVYRVLTRNYVPPAARQQVAEERRRERLEETERTAQHAWESERARWRMQRTIYSLHPAGSSTGLKKAFEAPSATWAQPVAQPIAQPPSSAKGGATSSSKPPAPAATSEEPSTLSNLRRR